MIQADSLMADTLVYGMSNVAQNNGWNIAFSGILVVFGGLVLIALTIYLFNKIAEKIEQAGEKTTDEKIKPEKITAINISQNIPADHLAAIATAVELYSRLHLETLESSVTFERGETNTNWKTGARFGQRKSMR